MTYNVNYRMSSRDDILRAAAEAFRLRGYEAAGVADILKRSGYKPPTLYYHFGDKEGLYVTWCEESLGELGSGLRGANDSAQFAGVLTRPEFADPVAIRRDLVLMVRSESRERILRALGQNVDEPMTNLYFSIARDGGNPDLLDAWITGFLGAMSAMRLTAPRGKALTPDIAAAWATRSEKGWRLQEASKPPHNVD